MTTPTAPQPLPPSTHSLGFFSVTTGRIVVMDPSDMAAPVKQRAGNVIDGALIGLWRGTVYRRHIEGWGRHNVLLSLTYNGEEGDGTGWENCFMVPVEMGVVGMWDATTTILSMGVEEAERLCEEAHIKTWLNPEQIISAHQDLIPIDETSDDTIAKSATARFRQENELVNAARAGFIPAGIVRNGVVASTAFGDGEVQCQKRVVEGRVVGVRIVFADEDESDS